MTAAIPELLPCPFCGGEAGFPAKFGGGMGCIVCCSDPECIGYHYEQDEQGGWNHEKSKAEAITAWNRRAPAAAQAEINRATEAERERCAQIAASVENTWGDTLTAFGNGCKHTANHIAAAIRQPTGE